jgi:hypothetical protein
MDMWYLISRPRMQVQIQSKFSPGFLHGLKKYPGTGEVTQRDTMERMEMIAVCAIFVPILIVKTPSEIQIYEQLHVWKKAPSIN